MVSAAAAMNRKPNNEDRMKQSTALSPAAIWNQKNLPQRPERLGKTPKEVAELQEQEPLNSLQQSRQIVILAVVAFSALSLLWFLSRRD